ncbi:oligosaccharide flippase family protein [Amphritea sp. HPY]|uniref:oligosaccharide flippase family protein n=1 Tax=Amphritea sp. HPY TaxID=3421652 RepID=UPI003D7D0B03
MGALNKGGCLALSQGVVALSSLIRNIVIARIISPEDFGIASLFAVLVTFLEMMSGMSFDRQIVQRRSEGLTDFIGTVHTVEILRGAILSVTLFFLSDLYSSWFNLNDLGWAFKILALVPLLKGFINWDVANQQRDLLFVNTALVDSIPQVVTVCLVLPLAVYFNDYRVVLFLVVLQVLISVILTHILSRKTYYVRLNYECLRRIFGFGWPLLLNGFLIFLVFQADRVIIGKLFSLELLGYFSAAFAMTIMPSVIVAKVYSIGMLPLLSRSQERGDDENPNLIMLMFHLSLLTGLLVLVCAVLFGGDIYVFAYGDQYIEGKSFFVFLGIMHSIRIIRVGPTIIATSRAQTKVILKSNIVRSLAVCFSILWVYSGGGVYGILVAGIIGEVCALIYQVNFVNYGAHDKTLTLMMNKLITVGLLIGSFVYYIGQYWFVSDIYNFIFLVFFILLFVFMWLVLFDDCLNYKKIIKVINE